MNTQQALGINESYELKLLVGVHERSNRRQDDRIDLEFYLTAHDVVNQNGKVHVGPGKPLAEETLFSLGRFLSARSPDKSTRRFGMLPKHLLYIDGEQQRYVWYVPAHRGPIRFAPECKLKDCEILHPTLVFCCHGENLFVFAADADVPNENTTLLRAPYLNLHEPEQNLCKGNTNVNAVRKARTHEELLQAWESIFFHSKFSHGTGEQIQQLTKTKNKDYLKMLVLALKKFPYKTLKSTNKKLKDLCR